MEYLISERSLLFAKLSRIAYNNKKEATSQEKSWFYGELRWCQAYRLRIRYCNAYHIFFFLNPSDSDIKAWDLKAMPVLWGGKLEYTGHKQEDLEPQGLGGEREIL